MSDGMSPITLARADYARSLASFYGVSVASLTDAHVVLWMWLAGVSS